jgi:hypothetical protein
MLGLKAKGKAQVVGQRRGDVGARLDEARNGAVALTERRGVRSNANESEGGASGRRGNFGQPR